MKRDPKTKTDRAKELHRDTRSFVWLEDAGRDLHFAGRMLARTPAFSLLALLTLALGIGAVTVIYSVIHDVLLDPLPYPASDRLVNVGVRDTDTDDYRPLFSPAEFLDYQEQSRAFEAVIGTRGGSMVMTTSSGNELLRVVHVTPNFFGVMGLSPMMGRVIGLADVEPGAPPVAVLRHRAWVSYFGADPRVVGQTIRLDGAPRTIVGVMPPRFTWHAADVWIPGPIRRGTQDAEAAARNFQARLKTSVSLQEAEAQLAAIARRRAHVHPGDYPERFRVEVVNVVESVVGDFRGVLYSALAAVALLLLIACCNVANMLLARATSREREMTVRAALGAGQGRIVRQVVVESLLLALAGAAGGCLLAYAGIALFVPFLPQGPLPGEVEIGLDGAALVFSLGLAVLSAVLFGTAPALYSARRGLVEGLKSESRGVAGGRGRLRNTLVVSEIALSLVLLIAAGLLMRSFVSLVRVDLGFDRTNVLVLLVTFPPGKETASAERDLFYQESLQRIASLPGVSGAAASMNLPPWAGDTHHVEIAGRPHQQRRTASIQFCTEGYFRTLGIRFLRGRGFRAPAVTGAPGTAVVNETFATRYFGTEDVLGQQVGVTLPAATAPGEREQLVEIVGVVEDVKNQGAREAAAPHVFLPASSAADLDVLFVRTSADPHRSVSTIRAEIENVNPDVVLKEPGTLEEILGLSVYEQPRFSLIVFSVFAVIGTLLVAIGIFSVMSYAVSRQTREIAVRMALGARRGQIMAIVLRLGVRLLLAGVGAGLLTSFVTGRLIASQLWNTSPYDPLALAAAIAVIAAVALAGCYLPARRATRVDPMAALRQE
ncbi:MAG: ABC transporter permease [Vicinamibacteraceae bacterium]